MRLFAALWRKKMPNGHIFRGKDRLVKEVTPRAIQTIKNEYAIEEQNMFYLRHSYLTLEQSQGHARALGKHEKFLEEKRSIKKEFRPNVTLESRLGHVRFSESWE